MPADKADFANAQLIHELLCAVAEQGSKEEALECAAMDSLMGLNFCLILSQTREFLFRCAIAVQFGPVQSVASQGRRQGDPDTWGEDTLTQADKETADRIEAMTRAYNDTHDERLGALAPEDKSDPNQGFT